MVAEGLGAVADAQEDVGLLEVHYAVVPQQLTHHRRSARLIHQVFQQDMIAYKGQIRKE